MDNKLNGTLSFKGSDGKTHQATLDINSIIDIEDELEAPLIDIMRKTDMRTWRTILYHAIKTHEPDITPEQVGKIISGAVRPYDFGMSLIRVAFPKVEKEETVKPKGKDKRPM